MIDTHYYNKLNKKNLPQKYVGEKRLELSYFSFDSLMAHVTYLCITAEAQINEDILQRNDSIEYIQSSLQELNQYYKDNLGLENVIAILPISDPNVRIALCLYIKKTFLTYGEIQSILNIFFDFAGLHTEFIFNPEYENSIFRDFNVQSFSYFPVTMSETESSLVLTINSLYSKATSFYLTLLKFSDLEILYILIGTIIPRSTDMHNLSDNEILVLGDTLECERVTEIDATIAKNLQIKSSYITNLIYTYFPKI